MADERIWYGTFFDRAQCSATTKRGTQCRMSAIWRLRSTGELYCDQHAEPVFRWFKDQREKEADVPAVHAGD